MFLNGTFLGLSNFQYVPVTPTPRAYKIVTIYGGNVIIDKLQIENCEMSDDDLANINMLKLFTWNPNTTILCSEFSNTLDGGNVVNLTSKVTQFKVYRREIGNDLLELVASVDA